MQLEEVFDNTETVWLVLVEPVMWSVEPGYTVPFKCDPDPPVNMGGWMGGRGCIVSV